MWKAGRSAKHLGTIRRMPLTSGQIFAGYRILRPLGSGAMGEVYLAQHPRLPRKDALKVLPADLSADANYRARFAREADLASTLWHPNIVGVHDRGEDGQLWISMDYVEGVDAARLVAGQSPAGLLPQQVIKIVTAVASALDYAHDRGLLHRDVKPANIMITSDEQRILLADFGIARSRDDISGLTATNTTIGTVAYAAPEQLMGDVLDGRADQYALAATAYHLLIGSQLFPHSNPAVVISRHLNAKPPALADSRPELAALDPVLSVALAKNPSDRFPKCTTFAHALALSRFQPVVRTKPSAHAPTPAPSMGKSIAPAPLAAAAKKATASAPPQSRPKMPTVSTISAAGAKKINHYFRAASAAIYAAARHESPSEEHQRLSQEQKRPPQEQKRPPPPQEQKRLSQEQKRLPQEQKRLPQEQKRPPQEQKRPPQEQKRPPQEIKGDSTFSLVVAVLVFILTLIGAAFLMFGHPFHEEPAPLLVIPSTAGNAPSPPSTPTSAGPQAPSPTK
jgi:serine/threonine protein kinase